MPFNASLTSVRYYTQLDPYYYTVDNRPLSDLAARDVQISDELDRRTLTVDVNTSGSSNIKLPTGWTTTSNGTGDLTITHNLGYTTYIAVAGVSDPTAGFATVFSFDSTTIRVKTFNTGGTAANRRVHVLVIGY